MSICALALAGVITGALSGSPAFAGGKAPSTAQTVVTTSKVAAIQVVQLAPTELQAYPDAWCVRSNGAKCSPSDVGDRRFRKILILPAGYTASEAALFRGDFDKVVANNGPQSSSDGAWSALYASKILYLGNWLPGEALPADPKAASNANFHAKVGVHPVRGVATTLNQAEVIHAVDMFKSAHPAYSVVSTYNSPGNPPDLIGVLVVLNSLTDNVTSNAAPPSTIGNAYGIAKTVRSDIVAGRPLYVSVHELGHAALNFLDEYTEGGLESLNIRSLDYATPFAVLGQGWGNILDVIQDVSLTYDYKLSEIIAANGNDNIDITRYPSRVSSSGYASQNYDEEGGMFFGKGTFHTAQRNLMHQSDRVHSSSQLGVLRQLFETPERSPRPNDRVRNAGPFGLLKLKFGSSARVMLYDGDKNHQFHPTRAYDVQVGWYDRRWETCHKDVSLSYPCNIRTKYCKVFGVNVPCGLLSDSCTKVESVPYPCVNDYWTVAEKPVAPAPKYINLKASAVYGLASLLQQASCAIGVKDIHTGSGDFQVCALTLDQMSSAFLPSIVYSMPYQDTDVPMPQILTKYYWRFKTRNDGWESGYTGWSEFYRAF